MRLVSILFLAALLALQPASATLPGPTELIRCPEGFSLRLRHSLASGNTFGALVWTDGYLIAMGLPRYPQLSRCGAGGALYRVAEAEVVGRSFNGKNENMPPKWHLIQATEATEARDYQEALDANWARSRKEEMGWRLDLWHQVNRPLRHIDPGRRAENPFRRGAPDRDNLLRLLALLDTQQESDRLLAAELLRALELYQSALQQLETPFTEHRRALAEQIGRLARREDPLVRPVENEAWARIRKLQLERQAEQKKNAAHKARNSKH